MDNILALHGLSGSGLKATEKADLVNIVNGAVANNDVIKTNMINAINGKLGTNLTLDKGWADVQGAISGWINPKANDKRWASGTVTSNGTLELIRQNVTDTNVYSIYVTGLSFTPSIVIATPSTYNTQPTLFMKGVDLGNGVSTIQEFLNSTTPLNQSYTFVVSNNSFKLPVSPSGILYNWIAFE